MANPDMSKFEVYVDGDGKDAKVKYYKNIGDSKLKYQKLRYKNEDKVIRDITRNRNKTLTNPEEDENDKQTTSKD